MVFTLSPWSFLLAKILGLASGGRRDAGNIPKSLQEYPQFPRGRFLSLAATHCEKRLHRRVAKTPP